MCLKLVDSFRDDSDGDGVKDWQDNCPWVFNPNQEDTDLVAEVEDQINSSCVALPIPCSTLIANPHARPTSASGWANDAYHAFFPGDACDSVVSTESGRTAKTFGDGVTGPCRVVTLCPPFATSTVDKTLSCEHQLDTQLKMSSWVSNFSGEPNPSIVGSTQPFFCRCDGASSVTDPASSALACNVSATNKPCIAADDSTAAGNSTSSPGPNNFKSGWRALSERVGSANQIFDPVNVMFQPRIQTATDESVVHNWNMRADFGKFNAVLPPPQFLVSLEGITWSQVQDVTPFIFAFDRRTLGTLSAFGPFFVQGMVENLDNHYYPMLATESLGLKIKLAGGCGILWTAHIGGWFDGFDHDPGPGPVDRLPWYQFTGNSEVVRSVGSQVSLETSSFSPEALTMLAGVATGTFDFIVGDDVAEGVMAGTTPQAVVIVDHDTTTVRGALHQAAGRVEFTPAGRILPSPDPPELRVYAAYDAVLYSLHPGSTASLTAVDVMAALAGTRLVTSTTLSGALPVAPMALVWNRFSRSLLVVDMLAGNRHDEKTLRLLNIDPVSGQSTEVWRTTPDRDAPSTAFLSVSAAGELVLALIKARDQSHDEHARDGKTEIVLFTSAGQLPKLSSEVHGKPMDAPQAVPAGVDVPLEPLPSEALPVNVNLIRRSDMASSICGARWLKTHATGVLAVAAARCKD